MSLGRYNLVPLRNSLAIIILYNYVSQCNCLSILNKTVSDLGLHNLTFPDLKVISALEKYIKDQKNEDIYLNGTQLIQKYGYKSEEYHVTTSDGYKLGLHRIPGDGPVVFIMHGLLGSFVDWLTVGPNQGLPYLLAAGDYDVWMGNARGNTFSRFNDHLSPNDAEFWDFSFHEIGSIDVPTMIDYILAKTGKKKLIYIGHSQGTTAFFILCSIKPEYNDKIQFMVALSAVAWMKNVPNPFLQIAAPSHSILYALTKTLGLYEIAPDNDGQKFLTRILCGNSLRASIVCQNLRFLIVGFDYSQMDYKQLPVMFSHNPSGSSVKQVEHYFQLIVSGYFRNFDYGTAQNLAKYGSVTPPSYPVDKITVPIAIFYSHGDWLSSPIDVEKLRSKLNNVVDYYEIPLRTFNHMDYLWAKDVKKIVYDRILHLIKQQR